MLRKMVSIYLLMAVVLPGAAYADQLTQVVQQDLTSLGYNPGNTNGEATTQTIIAISKFQAEHDLEVTGEVSPQLAGVIKAAIKKQTTGPQVAAGTPAAQDPQALKAAQQACLQNKIANAQQANKTKRGFGSLMRAVGRTAGRFGGGEIARKVSQASYDIYEVNATAADLESAANDLGLTKDDVEACRNPN